MAKLLGSNPFSVAINAMREGPRTPRPEKVYRFFSDPKFATDLASGYVWLSTLEDCRTKEASRGGDVGEAVQRYVVIGEQNVDSRDPASIRRAASALVMARGPIFGGKIVNSVAIHHMPDGYVICTTTRYPSEKMARIFGPHCVEIFRPWDFFQCVSREVKKRIKVEFSGSDHVTYGDRIAWGDMEPRMNLGFRKPEIPFDSEREFRMLWTPADPIKLRPNGIEIPEAAAFCRVIS